MPEKMPFDHLFIGEELDTSPEEMERVERLTSMAVAINRHSSANQETSSFVKDTRDVLKRVNGQPFFKDTEKDEEDPDELYLEEEADDDPVVGESHEMHPVTFTNFEKISAGSSDDEILNSDTIPDMYEEFI